MGVTYFNRRRSVHISGKLHTCVDRPQSEWAVIDGATPAIVDADLFRTVQARLDQPMVRPVPPHTRYLLSGIIRCARGAHVSGHELQKNHDYPTTTAAPTRLRAQIARGCVTPPASASQSASPPACDEVC